MRSIVKVFVAIAVIAMAGATALAQNPTSTLIGRATDGKDALPGVTVSVSSPSLQGIRTAATEVTGDYLFAYLPPGDYKIRFELQGFQTLETTVRLSAAQTATVNATMPVTKVAEEVTVVGAQETISSSQQVATTIDQNLLNTLPAFNRNLVTAASLAPGVTSTGPRAALVISGASSYENIYMVNGVVIQDNIRNTPSPLFIEDAVQETTTQTAAISAEYGRFAGGVVNTLTKSGGNELHATFRDTLTSDKWAAKTPKTTSRADNINQIYEATVGGWIAKDHLWYFAAGRSRTLKNELQTWATNIAFPQTDTEKRYEGKLTYSINPNHRLIGSYLKVDSKIENRLANPTVMDLAGIDRNPQFPYDLKALNYTGVLTNNFFVEGQYSKKTMSFVGSGSQYTDLIKGTTVRDNVNGWFSNTSPFCGVCGPENRDNEDWLVKGSWFAASSGLGSHDIVFGYDSFRDSILSNNHQSGSDWTFWPNEYLTDAAGNYVLDPTLHQPILIVTGDGNSDFTYYKILNLSKGTDFRTNSTFVNDRWRLNSHLSFNLGARYDKNDGKDANGNVVAKDSRVSPRLGVVYDLNADGSWLLNGNYAHYVTAVAGSIASQGAGDPSRFGYFYEGPDLNTDCDPANPGACLNAHQVLEQVFAWLFANGTNANGTPAGREIGYGAIAGLSRIVAPGLKSPYAEEVSLGVTKRLGDRGLVRLDFVKRQYKDMYAMKIDMTTGRVTDEFGNVSDIQLIVNDHTMEKKYDGATVQFAYRLRDTLNVGGNYTWSHLYGNYEGENVGSGPIWDTQNTYLYPEYSQASWHNPKGDLSGDQRHTGRVWAAWDVVNSRRNTLNVSVMQSYFSGQPYGANGSVYSYPYVTNPGYANRPTTVGYWFTARDAYHTDNITRTDLALNYSFKVKALGAGIEFYVHPQLMNVFNEHGVTAVDTTVKTRATGSSWLLFNPFTATPVECPQGAPAADCKSMGANWQKGPSFGQPLSAASYQLPRTFQVSFGVRF
ncbi:MAG: TonB-dependent receptor [Thermoanaerobaculaceae bacterium]|nr:TonB-dependent receptor [Thermoanaerobaculaceae bacterium]